MLLKFFNLDFIFRDSHILAELQDMENTFTNMEQVDIYMLEWCMVIFSTISGEKMY